MMPAPQRRGSALLACMLLLIALNFLALAAATDAGLQSRMAGNLEESRRATNHATAALAWAESWLLGLDGAQRPVPCEETCAAGRVVRAPGQYPESPEYENDAWWMTHGYRAGHDPEDGTLLEPAAAATAAAWIVEEVHFAAADATQGTAQDTAFYRVIARGTGPGAHTVSVLESVVARPWGDAAWTDPFPGEPGQGAFCRAFESPEPCGRLAWQRRR